MPQSKGNNVRITVFIDANPAHNQLTTHSVTGILLFVNDTPIKWTSQNQKTLDYSTYGSKLATACIATEIAIEIWYNLKMLDVPFIGPALMLGDNRSTVFNTTMPPSMLKKKHNAMAYHRVREAIAAGIVRFRNLRSDENLAVVLTKPLGC